MLHKIAKSHFFEDFSQRPKILISERTEIVSLSLESFL